MFLGGLDAKTEEEKRDLLDLLMRYNKYFLGAETRVCMTTKTNAVVAAFDNPNDAMRCAERYLFVLGNLYVQAYVAITWAMATIRHNRADGSGELLADSIGLAARLEPFAKSGEVLVLEEIRSHAATDRSRFEFVRVSRKWRRDVDHTSKGIDAPCYLVKVRQP
ncbi:MAG: hypothetical protein FD149_2550 [Rhodospirillaceae bacterium]|nr:MAG: hypothetical protein FD149_2550 [Rhodospirillaceae bacterium]